MINFFKQIDYFRKLQQDVEPVQTQTGGVISCITFILVLALIAHQIQVLIFGDLVKLPYVADNTVDDKVRVNLNITMHDISCGFLSIDYQDVTGTHLENIQFDIYKLRIDEDGQFIDQENVEQIRELESRIFNPSKPTWDNKSIEKDVFDCYGAEMNEGQKCTSCSDVMLAYSARGWPLPPVEAIAQCQPDHKAKITFEEIEQKQKEEEQQMMQRFMEQQKAYEDQVRQLQREAEQKQKEEERKRQIQAQKQKELDEQKKKQEEMIKKQKEQEEEIKRMQQQQEELKNQQQQQQEELKKQQQQEEEQKKQQQQKQQEIEQQQKENLQEKLITFEKQISELAQKHKNKEIDDQNYEVQKDKIEIQVFELKEQNGMLSEDEKNILQELQKKYEQDDDDEYVFNLTKFQMDHIQNKILELQKDGENGENQTSQEHFQDIIGVLQQSLSNYSEQQRQKINLNITNTVMQINFNQADQQLETVSKLSFYRQECAKEIQFQTNFNITGVKFNGHYHEKLDQFTEMKMDKDQCQLNLDVQVNESENYLLIQYEQQKFEYTFDHQNEIYELTFKIQQEHQQQQQTQKNDGALIFITNTETTQEQQEDTTPKRRNLFAEDYGHEHGTDQSFSMQELEELQQEIGQQCQIYGHMVVKKVPGNFHISFHGKGLANMFLQRGFSASHTINLLEFTTENGELSYGQYLPTTNPLDGQFVQTPVGFDVDYYLKLVNAQFENFLYLENQDLFQYTALASSQMRNMLLPSLTFKYEFDPISMKYINQHESFTHFIVTICAIFGGALSLTKYLHKVLA